MKQKRKFALSKIFISLMSIALLSLSCGGGNKQSQKPVTLRFWKTFEDSENLQALFEAYRQKHPNVEIEYTKKNVENYEQDLLNALASGQGPDIFAINNSWLPKYLDKITPAPATTFNLKDYKETFVDALASDFVKDGKIYGTAMSVDSLGLYYNKDILGSASIATPPKTWAELSIDVQKIKRSDGRGYFTRSGAALGTNANVNRAVDILYLFMLQQRVKPFSDDGANPTFAESSQSKGNYYNPGEQALAFYTSFANPNSPNYNWNLRSDYSIDAFANGRAAFLFGYSFARATILQKSPNLNFDVASVPQPNLEDTSVNFANYWGEVVSKQSQNAVVAWDFLKFITSKQSLDQYYAATKQPASRKDLIELQIQDPEIGVFANANLTAKTFFKPDATKMDQIFGKLIDNVILNGLSVPEALNQAQAQAATLTQE